MSNIFYTPKPGTAFIHLEDMVDFDAPELRDRTFLYRGGKGLVYQIDEKTRNANYPLTRTEFEELPSGDSLRDALIDIAKPTV